MTMDNYKLNFKKEESELNFYRESLENLGIFIAQIDSDLRYRKVINLPDKLEKEDILGKTDLEILWNKSSNALYNVKKQALESGESYQIDLPFVLEDGRHFFKFKIDPIWRDDSITGLTMSAHDISDKIFLQNKLIQAEKIAAIGELTSGFAHEFKNILATIIGNVQILEYKYNHNRLDLPASVKEKLTAINQQSHKAKRIIMNMMSFCKISELNLELHNICELLDRVIELQKNQYTIDHINVVTIYDEIEKFYYDEEQMEHVFLNLSMNAIHALQLSNGGTMKISVKNEKDEIVIRFSDTGVGMDQEIKNKIFTPFFTTKSDDKEMAGSGLGLPISYKIIKNHQGEMFVESEPGEGTTFVIKLPYKREG